MLKARREVVGRETGRRRTKDMVFRFLGPDGLREVQVGRYWRLFLWSFGV